MSLPHRDVDMLNELIHVMNLTHSNTTTVCMRCQSQAAVDSSDALTTRLPRWLGSLVVRASDLRLNGREFDPQPPNYKSIGAGIGDRLRTGMPPRYVTSHTGQPSLLPSVGREMNTGQNAVMLCGWE